MERDSLILYAKIEALFFQVYPTFKNYPKAEKHGLCQHMKEGFIRLLEKVGVAKEVPSRRKTALQEAAGHLHNPAEVKQSLTSWYSYAAIARCQRFIEDACRRTRHIRFTHQRFIVRLPCSATT